MHSKNNYMNTTKVLRLTFWEALNYIIFNSYKLICLLYMLTTLFAKTISLTKSCKVNSFLDEYRCKYKLFDCIHKQICFNDYKTNTNLRIRNNKSQQKFSTDFKNL